MEHFNFDASCHQVLWLAVQVISYREGAVPVNGAWVYFMLFINIIISI